jgi:ABC-type antimicrobial peptide transport system permease subunit
MYLTAAGAVAGTAGAVLLQWIARSFFHGMPSLDTGALVIVPPIMMLVALGGACLPAWRALRISPTVALRAE